jgi:hypothetical protein
MKLDAATFWLIACASVFGIMWLLCQLDRLFSAINNGREQRVIRKFTANGKGKY